MSQRFNSSVRLKARPEFLVVQEHGRRVATKYATVLAVANGRACDRLGLIASRKFGKAVARNRAKRRLREIFRRLEPDTIGERGLKGLDLVVIPRRALLDASFAVVDADLSAAITRLRGQV